MAIRARDRMTLAIDFAPAMDARERGIERAGTHADAIEDGWRHQALSLLTMFSRRIGRPFLIEEARLWAEQPSQGPPPPPDARAWGSVVRIAANRKRPRIRKTGGYGRAASSNCSEKPLWVACLHGVPTPPENCSCSS